MISHYFLLVRPERTLLVCGRSLDTDSTVCHPVHHVENQGSGRENLLAGVNICSISRVFSTHPALFTFYIRIHKKLVKLNKICFFD